MIKESVAWGGLKQQLKTYFKANQISNEFYRVENKCVPGYPDVTYCIQTQMGMIETKIAEYVRSQNALAPRHYTPQQRVFSLQWQRAGGLGFLAIFYKINGNKFWAFIPMGSNAAMTKENIPLELIQQDGHIFKSPVNMGDLANLLMGWGHIQP